jgi:hypothetical protein
MLNAMWATAVQEAHDALESADVARMQVIRDKLIDLHQRHHHTRTPPLDNWEDHIPKAFGPVYCTGCQIFPIIVRLHEAIKVRAS